MSLKALGYIGANAVNLKEWKDYACDIFGAQVVAETADQLKLRLDDKHHRMSIHKADAPGARHFGWDAGSRDGLAGVELLHAVGVVQAEVAVPVLRQHQQQASA